MPVEKVFICESGFNSLDITPCEGFITIVIKDINSGNSHELNLNPEDITELIEELKTAKAHAEEE